MHWILCSRSLSIIANSAVFFPHSSTFLTFGSGFSFPLCVCFPLFLFSGSSLPPPGCDCYFSLPFFFWVLVLARVGASCNRPAAPFGCTLLFLPCHSFLMVSAPPPYATTLLWGHPDPSSMPAYYQWVGSHYFPILLAIALMPRHRPYRVFAAAVRRAASILPRQRVFLALLGLTSC